MPGHGVLLWQRFRKCNYWGNRWCGWVEIMQFKKIQSISSWTLIAVVQTCKTIAKKIVGEKVASAKPNEKVEAEWLGFSITGNVCNCNTSDLCNNGSKFRFMKLPKSDSFLNLFLCVIIILKMSNFSPIIEWSCGDTDKNRTPKTIKCHNCTTAEINGNVQKLRFCDTCLDTECFYGTGTTQMNGKTANVGRIVNKVLLNFLIRYLLIRTFEQRILRPAAVIQTCKSIAMRVHGESIASVAPCDTAKGSWLGNQLKGNVCYCNGTDYCNSG